MTLLSVVGQTQSAQSILDHGITDVLVHGTPGGNMLYTVSGQNGGVAAYALDPGGQTTLVDFAHFEPGFAENLMQSLTVLDTPAGPRLVIAGDPDGSLTAYELGADGTIGNIAAIGGLSGGAGNAVLDLDQWGGDTLFIANAGSGSIQSYGMGSGPNLTQAMSVADTPTIYADTVFALETLTIGGIDYLIGASATDQGVTAYRIDADQLVPTGSLGIAEGIGIMTPTALATVEVDGRCFVLIGSSPGDGLGQSGAITVMELHQDGQLTATDHVIDTLETRFGNIQTLDVSVSNGFTYVVAAGGDDGLCLFVLMPNGRLQLIDVMADDHSVGLENVSALASAEAEGALHLFVASELSPGLTEITLDTSRNGMSIVASQSGGSQTGSGLDDILLGGVADDHLAGSAGDDILEDGAGRDTLNGGDGNDIFVLRGDGEVDAIADFEPGRDRLDLSDWPFFYAPAGLTVQPTSDGAIVTWRDETLVIHTLNGGSLTLAAVVGAILQTPDRSPILFDQPPGDLDQSVAGTAGADVISGADGDDTIDGRAGDDLLSGGGGHDVVMAGDGNDTIDGGGGGDHVDSGVGFDVIDGGPGNDTLLGNAGFDVITGGVGADELFGNMGQDTLWGEDADDRLLGGYHADSLHGGDGNDTLFGHSGMDSLIGAAGNDFLKGGSESDHLEGGDGADTLHGQADGDILFGDGGNDRIIGGQGNDSAYGGADDDRVLGLLGNDTLFGESGQDEVFGGAGNDLLFGGAGDDLVRGGLGNDTLTGDGGNDSLYGGSVDDTLHGGTGFDRIRGWGGDDLIEGGAHADNLAGNQGRDTLYGGHGHDVMFGGGGSDTLVGGEGHDGMHGGNGDDFVSGGSGDDRLTGSFGFDTLDGGAGDDLMTGGMNGDTFVFNDGHGIDTVTDFNALNPLETLDLSGIPGIATVSDLLATATQEGFDVRIDTGGGNAIWLTDVVLSDLDSSDVIL